MIAVWWLIIYGSFTGSGQAAVTVPQASREQCMANAAFINGRHNRQFVDAVCIPGVLK